MTTNKTKRNDRPKEGVRFFYQHPDSHPEDGVYIIAVNDERYVAQWNRRAEMWYPIGTEYDPFREDSSIYVLYRIHYLEHARITKYRKIESDV